VNDPKAVQSMEQLMAQALAMEREAVTRYSELAEMMEAHNNLDVAELFRKMAGVEGLHVRHILDEMGWNAETAPVVAEGAWSTPEAPEAVPIDEMHYLMHPWHALQLARAAEQRAADFFAALGRQAADEALRRAAEQMRGEEVEHVALIDAWLAKVPPPDPDWAVDPDPPRYED
jgi:rubrerythrin